MSQSEFWAKLCAGKIDIDSSIQAQVTGEVMRRKWRIIGISYRCFIHRHFASAIFLLRVSEKSDSPNVQPLCWLQHCCSFYPIYYHDKHIDDEGECDEDAAAEEMELSENELVAKIGYALKTNDYSGLAI